MSSKSDRIPDTAPDKQKGFALLVAEDLGDPALSGHITKNNLDEAYHYVTILRGTPHQIDANSSSKIAIALMPAVPTLPPGYLGDRDKQIEYLNMVKSELNNPSKRAKIPNNILKESLYYADILKRNPNNTENPQYVRILDTLFREQFRRIKPPFRLPESSRPSMPREALIPSGILIQQLAADIYMPLRKGEAGRQEAYHKIVDTYLTDWVNREGFIKNGVQMHYRPLYDDTEFLINFKKYITHLLTKCEEPPNPKTLNKRPGNSTRQKLLKDILEKINTRITLLLDERFDKLIASEGGQRMTRKRITRKRRHSKRHYTRRN